MEDFSINISVKTDSNISSETGETANFHFSQYKSVGNLSCYSNQSSYPTGIKTQFMQRLMSLICMQGISFIHLMISEKKIF